MTQQPSAALVAAHSRASRKPEASDSLAKLKEAAARARVLEVEIEGDEEALKRKRESLNALYQSTLVDLMVEAGVDTIGVAAIGNYPAMDFKMRGYYSANIAASWPAERREEAFSLVSRLGGSDMIRTEVSVLFPPGGLKLAKKLVALARKIKIPVKVKKKTIKSSPTVELVKTIPSGTLKAWLRERTEAGRPLSASDLEKIAGSVGRIVKPEERKE